MRKLSKKRKILLSVIGILLLFSIIIAINFVFRSDQQEPVEPVTTEKETEEGEPARNDTIVEDTDLN